MIQTMWYDSNEMITKNKNQVFLGGTCGDNDWRTGFINDLVKSGVDKNKLFNPVV